jgi:hypothetical protein
MIFDGIQIHYNYVRSYMSLNGETLAQACGMISREKIDRLL